MNLTKFYIQLIVSSIICSTGFIVNSETTVIGSMLISPIGSLILKTGKRIFNKMNKIKTKRKLQLIINIAITLFIPILMSIIYFHNCEFKLSL